jgi:PAB1-binding protein PBP1
MPSINEERWQAEYDAQTLAEAEKIKSDPARHDRAKTAAQRMVEEKAEEAKAMRKVARKRGSGGGSTRPSAPTRPQNSGGSPGSKVGKFNVFKKI